MKILHYFLGFPPYRTGGMTTFAMDLMCSQVNDGNEVISLWPGKMNFIFDNKTKIKHRKKNNGIDNYEIINPLPVPLDEGIKDIKYFIKSNDNDCYEIFLNELKPEIIHIHTLMGIHREFIEAANKLGIKTIFTTHDYFGICPKVTLYKYGSVCDEDMNCSECVKCNCNALSIMKIKLIQNPVYRLLKNSFILKCVRKKHRNRFFYEEETKNKKNMVQIDEKKKYYKQLRDYYISILEKIDCIHFNSNLTKDIYLKYLTPKNYKMISISHKNIVEHKKIQKKGSDKVRFTYLASTKPYKGFYLLKEALDELYKNSEYKFELNVYSQISENDKSEYMKVYDNGFTQDELEKIFAQTDILVAPSIWYETFGFTVIEALNYGVPVLISSNVGAKDVVGEKGIIFNANDKNSLIIALKIINKEKIISMKNKTIKLKMWNDFYNEIIKLYKDKL